LGKRDVSHSDVILAAGGLVWRDSERGRQIAVVHRPNDDDWTLPKGKLDPGERWQDGAVREVEEETGFEVRLGAFAGSSSYLTGRAPKVVLYWHMEVDGEPRFAPENPSEVDALEWLSVAGARRRLTHERDRRVLRESNASQARWREGARRWREAVTPSRWLRRMAGLASHWRSLSRKRLWGSRP